MFACHQIILLLLIRRVRGTHHKTKHQYPSIIGYFFIFLTIFIWIYYYLNATQSGHNNTSYTWRCSDMLKEILKMVWDAESNYENGPIFWNKFWKWPICWNKWPKNRIMGHQIWCLYCARKFYLLLFYKPILRFIQGHTLITFLSTSWRQYKCPHYLSCAFQRRPSWGWWWSGFYSYIITCCVHRGWLLH